VKKNAKLRLTRITMTSLKASGGWGRSAYCTMGNGCNISYDAGCSGSCNSCNDCGTALYSACEEMNCY
jgi:hypothetical protein